MRLAYIKPWHWLLLVAVAGCRGAVPAVGDAIGGRTAGPLAYELAKVSSCEDAEQELRDAALVEMNAQLDQALAGYLEHGDICTATFVMEDSGSAPRATSGTNNQVASVDEADFIKHDGHYIYRVGPGALTVLEAWPAANTRVVGRVTIDGTPVKLFIQGDLAAVYVSVPRGGSTNAEAATSPSLAAPRGACTYGYGCRFEGDGNDTAILLFDLTDRTAPKLLRRFDINSSLIAARRIGNTVHTVVAQVAPLFGVKTWPAAVRPCTVRTAEVRQDARSAFEQLRQENIEKIQNTPLIDVWPTLREDGVAPAEPPCDAIYRAADGGSAFTSLLSFDLSSNGGVTQSTIISRPGAVYASAETLYIAVPQTHSPSEPWFEELSQEQEASSVHAFRIGTDPTASAYLGSGVVKGRVLNQFSMDEHRGNLRIATTSGHLPSPDTHNTLSVLSFSDRSDRNEGRLQLQGQIDHIAPGEDIRSVRFDGDRGFMVTFKKTDPLFTFDLSKPEEPKLLGELMIPGFSTYIHMLDDEHLLTIGYDADDHGDFAYFDGVILQIFDIGDPQVPALTHKATIGTRGSSSEALADHLAFTLFQGKLALPMTICEGGGDGAYGTDMTFSGLIIYDVSVEKGFSESGRVANPPSSGQYNNSLCQNWWSNAASEVKRSIFMDEYVYAISPNAVHVQDTRALGRDIATVHF